MLGIFRLNAITLCNLILSVIMLIVIMLSGITSGVLMLTVLEASTYFNSTRGCWRLWVEIIFSFLAKVDADTDADTDAESSSSLLFVDLSTKLFSTFLSKFR